jgi:hypothetical protein
MAQTARNHARSLVWLVKVPADWHPKSASDTPPNYQQVDRVGGFPADLAEVLVADWNNAEIAARRAGAPHDLWMVSTPGRQRKRSKRRVKGGVA